MSYKLNLVTHRGGLLNMIEHPDLAGLRREADQQSWLLNVPFWDGDLDQGETVRQLKMEVLQNISWSSADVKAICDCISLH